MQSTMHDITTSADRALRRRDEEETKTEARPERPRGREGRERRQAPADGHAAPRP